MTDRNDILCGPVDADGYGLNRSAAHSVLLLAACFLIQFLTGGVVFSNGVLLVPLQEHFDTSQITAAWLFSIQMFFYFFSGTYIRLSKSIQEVDRAFNFFSTGAVFIRQNLIIKTIPMRPEIIKIYIMAVDL